MQGHKLNKTFDLYIDRFVLFYYNHNTSVRCRIGIMYGSQRDIHENQEEKEYEREASCQWWT